MTASSPKPSVGVVIPSYNGRADLERCLASLGLSTYPRLSVLVVDNGSADGSATMVREQYPLVTVDALAANRGFAGACNRGAGAFLARGFDYVALLNQDVVVEPGWVEPLVQYLEAHTDTASAQPLILLLNDRTVVNSLGNHIHYLGFGYAGGNGLALADSRAQRFLNAPTDITYASGAAVVLRAAHVRELGLFQDEFFMYHEDLDFGWRVRLAGYRNVLVPASQIYHRYDFHRSGPLKYEYGERNRLLVLLENYHALTLVLLFPAWLIMEVGVVATSLLRGWFGKKARGYAYVIVHWPEIRRVRRARQCQRRCSEREVVKTFAGDIRYQDNAPLLLSLVNPFLRAYWAVVRRCIVW